MIYAKLQQKDKKQKLLYIMGSVITLRYGQPWFQGSREKYKPWRFKMEKKTAEKIFWSSFCSCGAN